LKEVNDELCDARQVIRMQKKNVESSESLSRYWKKESWKYKDEAKTYYYQAQKYMADLIAAEKKLKKADRDRVARETESNNVYEINSREIRKLKYKVKDLERAAAQELTQIAAKLMQIAPITTIDSPPALPAKENMQVTLGTTIDIPPTPAPEPAKPSEHSSGSAANPSTIAGRKIAKPVSRAGKAKPRTARDEIDLLVEYFKQATADRKKAPSKELKYDIIFQMSKITNVFESGNLEDVEWALDALTSISFDVASGNTTFPEFMADMAVALCDQLEDYLEQQSDENQGQEENGECDEGDGDEGNKGEDKDKYKDQSKADEEEESEEE